MLACFVVCAALLHDCLAEGQPFCRGNEFLKFEQHFWLNCRNTRATYFTYVQISVQAYVYFMQFKVSKSTVNTITSNNIKCVEE